MDNVSCLEGRHPHIPIVLKTRCTSKAGLTDCQFAYQGKQISRLWTQPQHDQHVARSAKNITTLLQDTDLMLHTDHNSHDDHSALARAPQFRHARARVGCRPEDGAQESLPRSLAGQVGPCCDATRLADPVVGLGTTGGIASVWE